MCCLVIVLLVLGFICFASCGLGCSVVCCFAGVLLFCFGCLILVCFALGGCLVGLFDCLFCWFWVMRAYCVRIRWLLGCALFLVF